MLLEHRLVVTQTLLKETEDVAVQTLVEVARQARKMSDAELAGWLERQAERSHQQHAVILGRAARELRKAAA